MLISLFVTERHAKFTLQLLIDTNNIALGGRRGEQYCHSMEIIGKTVTLRFFNIEIFSTLLSQGDMTHYHVSTSYFRLITFFMGPVVCGDNARSAVQAFCFMVRTVHVINTRDISRIDKILLFTVSNISLVILYFYRV